MIPREVLSRAKELYPEGTEVSYYKGSSAFYAGTYYFVLTDQTTNVFTISDSSKLFYAELPSEDYIHMYISDDRGRICAFLFNKNKLIAVNVHYELYRYYNNVSFDELNTALCSQLGNPMNSMQFQPNVRPYLSGDQIYIWDTSTKYVTLSIYGISSSEVVYFFDKSFIDRLLITIEGDSQRRQAAEAVRRERAVNNLKF
jgi:hypothetical protein